MSEEMSRKARLVKNMIMFATSRHFIGPRLKDGTIRQHLVEPPWHCPDGYINMPIRMERFEMELLTPPQADEEHGQIILQLHGGGYIAKIRNAYRDVAVFYSKMPGNRRVLSVDYRVADENPYPAALEDAVDAYQWLLNAGYSGDRIILAGDSAGGGLVLALAMYLRDHEISLPRCLVMMSPWTDLTASGASYQDNYEKDPLFGNTRESMIYNGAYAGGYDPKTPYISPMFGDFHGLPPMLFQVGGDEMLLSDSVDAAAKAEEAGGCVRLSVYEEMYHVFQLALEHLPESEKAWKEVEEFLDNH